MIIFMQIYKLRLLFRPLLLFSIISFGVGPFAALVDYDEQSVEDSVDSETEDVQFFEEQPVESLQVEEAVSEVESEQGYEPEAEDVEDSEEDLSEALPEQDHKKLPVKKNGSLRVKTSDKSVLSGSKMPTRVKWIIGGCGIGIAAIIACICYPFLKTKNTPSPLPTPPATPSSTIHQPQPAPAPTPPDPQNPHHLPDPVPAPVVALQSFADNNEVINYLKQHLPQLNGQENRNGEGFFNRIIGKDKIVDEFNLRAVESCSCVSCSSQSSKCFLIDRLSYKFLPLCEYLQANAWDEISLDYLILLYELRSFYKTKHQNWLTTRYNEWKHSAGRTKPEQVKLICQLLHNLYQKVLNNPDHFLSKELQALLNSLCDQAATSKFDWKKKTDPFFIEYQNVIGQVDSTNQLNQNS